MESECWKPLGKYTEYDEKSDSIVCATQDLITRSICSAAWIYISTNCKANKTWQCSVALVQEASTLLYRTRAQYSHFAPAGCKLSLSMLDKSFEKAHMFC